MCAPKGKHFKPSLLACLSVVVLTGCGAILLPDAPVEDTSLTGPAAQEEPTGNQPPVVDVGPDLTVASETIVAVHAQASDPDDDAAMLAWNWTMEPSINAKLSPRQLVKLGHNLLFRAPVGPATLRFTFQVMDAHGASAEDDCVVTVLPPGQQAPPPPDPGPTIIVSGSAGRTQELTGSGPFYLEDPSADFLMDGVSPATDVLEIISGTNSVPGIYTITGVTTMDLTLSSSAGDSAVYDVVYRVLRP